MATELEELVIKLSADTDGLRNELKSATLALTKGTSSMEKSIESFSKNASKDVSFFENTMATMSGFIGGQIVMGAFNAVTEAVSAMAQAMISDGVKGAMETEQAMNRLATAMSLAGDYSDEALQKFGAIADQLERTTGVNDSTSLSLLALGKTMGFTNDEAEKLLLAANDLAAATGKDLETSFSELGKTASGSAGRLAMVIPALKGMSEEALKSGAAIDYVGERFKGSADANAKTLQGSLNVLGAQWGNVSKAIGKAITENGTMTMVINKLSNAMGMLINWVEQNKDSIADFVNTGIKVAIASFAAFLDVLGALTAGIKVFGNTVSNVFESIFSSFKAIGQALTGDFSGAWETFKQQAVENVTEIGDALDNNMFDDMAQKVKSFGQSVSDSMGTSAESVQVLKNSIAAPLEDVEDESAMKWAEKWIEAGQSVEAQNASMNELIAAQRENDLANHESLLMSKQEIELAYSEAKLEKLYADQEAETAALQAGLAARNASVAQTTAAMTALEQKHAAEKIKADTEVEKNRQNLQKLRLQQTDQMLGNLSTLAQTGNRELVMIGKAAGVAQAGINIAQGATKALAEGGPYLGPFLAASIVAAGAVQISKIMSTNLATGIDEVPGVGNRDNFPAMLAPGERVVPKKTNEDLMAFLANQGQGGGAQSVEIQLTMSDNMMDMIEARIIERRRFGTGLGV